MIRPLTWYDGAMLGAGAGAVLLLALIIPALQTTVLPFLLVAYGAGLGALLVHRGAPPTLPASQNRGQAQQPVPEPVVKPAEVVVNNYRNQPSPPLDLPELVADVEDNRLATAWQPAGNQPATSRPSADIWQPAADVWQRAQRRTASDRSFLATVAAQSAGPLPSDNGIPWDQMLSAAGAAVADAIEDEPAAEDRDPLELPLPRREPLAIQYPLIWQAVREADTLNQAIYNLYGGKKDGLRHAWVRQVIAYYTDGPAIDNPLAIYRWRLMAGHEHPGALAGALGIDLDDDQLAELIADLQRCATCQHWQIASTIDLAGQCAGCR